MRISDWSSDVCSSELRVGRDIINAEIDECGRKDEQECCQHTDERPTRPVSPKRFLVHSHLLAISCVVRLRTRAARLRQSSWWWDPRPLLVRRDRKSTRLNPRN